MDQMEDIIVELGSMAALAIFGCALAWFIKRKRDPTGAVLREIVRHVEEDEGEEI